MVWIGCIYFSNDWVVDLLNFCDYGHDEYVNRSKRASKEFLCNHL